MLKDSPSLGHLVFTQQEKQVHHHQLLISDLNGKQKSKVRWEMVVDSVLPYSPVFLGHHACGTVGTHSAFSRCWKTLHEAQVFLSGLEREKNICKFYLAWNAVWSPWKCECASFSHYFIKNVASWARRESESKHFTSGHGEMHRKFHLQLELGLGI